uniref:Uncharacterized protein n=1 Tax=Rhizophora mucronata TaxID=61149 RepID=A0A2P2QP39_RHIMU
MQKSFNNLISFFVFSVYALSDFDLSLIVDMCALGIQSQLVIHSFSKKVILKGISG